MGIQPFFHKRKMLLAGAIVLMLFAGGCGRPAIRHTVPAARIMEKKAVPRMGYMIQAGAFANAEKSALLTRSLQEKGLAATYFLAGGLYKVRFGNFPTKESGPRQGGGDPRRRDSSRNSTSSVPRSIRLRKVRSRGRTICGRNWSGPHGAFSVFPTSGEAPPWKPVLIAAV